MKRNIINVDIEDVVFSLPFTRFYRLFSLKNSRNSNKN